MSTNSRNKAKQIAAEVIKKRVTWNQSLKPRTNIIKNEGKIKKSLQYIFLLKSFNNLIDYKNVKLLKAFLTEYGKILPRRKTRLSIQHQRALSKSIRKARAFGLIPFTLNVKA